MDFKIVLGCVVVCVYVIIVDGCVGVLCSCINIVMVVFCEEIGSVVVECFIVIFDEEVVGGLCYCCGIVIS